MDAFDPRHVRNPRVLSVIDVACHNEDLLSVLHAYFNIKQSMAVTIELYSVSNIENALTSAMERVGVQRTAGTSLDIRYETESVSRHGIRTGEYYFSLRILFPGNFTVILRMGDQRMNWRWQDFVEHFPCDQITHLSITNESGYNSPPIPLRPHRLVAALEGLRSLTVSDRHHIHLLNDVPLVAPITVVTVDLPGGTVIGDLVAIWHWLRYRSADPASTTLKLTGTFHGHGMYSIYEQYHYMEAPTIAALQMHAAVIDTRVPNIATTHLASHI
ncbi:unnamed protein product [Peniophora sp. CBMAI 1063]|nr:unnamed protein product [Peniophora sp. CBMAI 1063]